MRGWIWSALACLVAIMVPVVLLFMCEVIRRRRSFELKELLDTLFKDKVREIPALEFALNKYGVLSSNDGDHTRQVLTPTRKLVVSAIPHLLLSIAGFMLLLLPIATLTSATATHGVILVPNLFWTHDAEITTADLLRSAAVVGTAFLGGYIFTLGSLLRAVMNFELEPITWLRAAAHLVIGAIIALLVYRAGASVAGGKDSELWLGFAFIAGYWPSFGLVTIVRYLNVNYVKSVDSEVMKLAEIVPIEVIDGIDYDIRYRLEETNIADVQNLAVANPILLFVETPYGLYQTFDWVLQAQLCLVVGPKTFFELKRHNIRTILDLERAVLGDDAPDSYVRMIGNVIFSRVSEAQRGSLLVAPPGAQAPVLDAASIRHAVMVMADDLHVHRLRQLWDEISKRLGRRWIYRDDPSPKGP